MVQNLKRRYPAFLSLSIVSLLFAIFCAQTAVILSYFDDLSDGGIHYEQSDLSNNNTDDIHHESVSPDVHFSSSLIITIPILFSQTLSPCTPSLNAATIGNGSSGRSPPA